MNVMKPDNRNKRGGCLLGLLLIPLQIIFSIVTIPIMLIGGLFAGIAKLFEKK